MTSVTFAPHRRVSDIALIGGSGLVLVGTFLPWIRSGQVWRNSYALWRSADRLGVVSNGAAEALMALWFLLPLAMGCLLLALAFHHQRTAMALAGAIVLVPTCAAVLAWRAPLVAGGGVFVTLAGAMLVAFGIVSGWVARPSGSTAERPMESL